MPHIWNGHLVVTQDELVPAFYSERNLRAEIDRYKKKEWGIKRLQKGGNGRQVLVSYDSLSNEIKNAIPDPRKCDHILERFYKVDGGAVDFYTNYTFDDGSFLNAEHQEQYIVNASILKAVIALRESRMTERKSKSISLVGLSASLFEDAHSFQKTLKAKHKVEHTLVEYQRGFLEDLSKFENNGQFDYEYLISGKHKNQNRRKVTDEVLSLLQALFAGDRGKPTATEVYRRYDGFINGYIDVINVSTGEQYNPADFKALSDSTVKNYMAEWNSKIGTHQLRSDNRQLALKKFVPHFSFDKPNHAGSIISIDDRQPPFKMPNGERVWFYNAIDLGSEAFTCWVYGDSKEGIIDEFYRQLVRNYHEWGLQLPAEVEAEMSLNSKFVNTFLREGAMFQHTKILPNNARAKRIERYFRELRYKYEKDRNGWLARPNALSESNQAEVDTAKVPRIPYREIVENCLLDIQKWNNQPHSVHTDMSRWEVFLEMQNPNIKPTNYLSFMRHIGYPTPTSCNVGIIRLKRGEFLLGQNGKICLGDKLIGLMKQIEGRDVTVYWLDDNQGRVFKAMVYMGDQYICEAIAKPRIQRAEIEKTATDRFNESLMSAYKATIEGYGRRKKQAIDQVLTIDRTPEPRQVFKITGMPERDKYREEAGGQLPDPDQQEQETLNYNLNTVSFNKPLTERF